MEHPNEFYKIFRQVMSQKLLPSMSEEEIHVDVLAMEVIEQVGEKYVLWLN